MRKLSSTLLAIVLALISLGVVMLASTSSARAAVRFGDAGTFHFLERQLMWLVVSLVVGVLSYRIDYHLWQRHARKLFALSVVLLVLVLIPPIGSSVNGSYRWIRLGPLSYQPSELVKFSIIVMMAAWMTAIAHHAAEFVKGLVVPALLLVVPLGLLMLEPDFGTTLLVAVVGMTIMFVAGANTGYLLITATFGMCLFVVAVVQNANRWGRFIAFIMPEKSPEVAYQLAQSKAAFYSGGALGVGLGKSVAKHFYLPEAHTDFILAIVGEELGLVATGLVLALFVGVLICGLVISWQAPDMFGRLLGFGITLMLSLQAALNIGVVTGCLPTKGLPLPFISYGGSSLLMAVVCVAVLLNIAQHSASPDDDEHVQPIKDRAHRL